jgi:hypothetical protein
MTTPEITAERIDRLLAELRSSPDPRAAGATEELTRCLVQLYGDALARIAAMIGDRRTAELCADPLVESLLLVHDLHPVGVPERVRAALERNDIRVFEVGCTDDVISVQIAGSGCSAAGRAEAIVRAAAPEATHVIVETARPLLQIALRP